MTNETGPSLVCAFMLVRGYELREGLSVWTVCVGRWRIPVVTRRCDRDYFTPRMFGWMQRQGWVWL